MVIYGRPAYYSLCRRSTLHSNPGIQCKLKINFILKNKILKGTTLTKGYPLSKRGSISFEYPASSLQINSQSAGPLPIHNWSKTCGG